MKEQGADVELYYTMDLAIKPCLGDHACHLRTPGKCIQDDDMKWLLPKVGGADVLVLASPLYCDGVTGPMKMFMDRLIPNGQPFIEMRNGRMRHPLRDDLKREKPMRLVLVSSCGFWEMENFDPLLTHIKAFCENISADFAGALLRPHGVTLNAVSEGGAQVSEVVSSAREAGRQLIRDGRMSAETLNSVGRPLVPKDMFMDFSNIRIQEMLKKAGNAAPAGTPASPHERKGPSKMAENIALIRAGEASRPEAERICYDPYAIRFISPEVLEFMTRYPEQFRAQQEQVDRAMPGLGNTAVARVRYIDDTVKTALKDGIEQLVILGAGYDTRAYRIEGADKVRVFEVDHPDTVGYKMEKIREIFGALPAHVTYVPTDLEVVSLGQRLTESGYDPKKKTLFVLEGLIMYLPPGALDETFAFIAHNAGKGSAVVFDYGRVVSNIKDDKDMKTAISAYNSIKERGDLIKSGIAEPIEKFLGDRGFTKVKNMDAPDFKKAYFHGKNASREVSGLLSFAYAVVE
jgi:methyltransferase (TIGR00027 family)